MLQCAESSPLLTRRNIANAIPGARLSRTVERKRSLTASQVFSTMRDRPFHRGPRFQLAPIASGDIGFKDLLGAFKSSYAWIALISGILVALLAKGGVTLLAKDPHITTALVLGTIISVALFKAVAVGPLIGAGIAYVAMKIVELVSF